MTRRLGGCGLALCAALIGVGARAVGAGEPRPPVPDGLVAVTVRDVTFDPATQSPLVVLQTKAKDRLLIIAVGHAEAVAIALRLRGHKPLPRPMTHDLLKNVIARLGAKVARVVVTRLDKGIFYAELVVRSGKAVVRIDARPSDGIALALRTGAAVFVARAVLAEAGIAPDELPPKPKRRTPQPSPARPPGII